LSKGFSNNSLITKRSSTPKSMGSIGKLISFTTPGTNSEIGTGTGLISQKHQDVINTLVAM